MPPERDAPLDRVSGTVNINNGEVSGTLKTDDGQEVDISEVQALSNIREEAADPIPSRPRLLARPPLFPRMRGLYFPRFPRVSNWIATTVD